VLGVAIEGEDATVAGCAEHGKLIDRDRHTLEAPSPRESTPTARLTAFRAFWQRSSSSTTPSANCPTPSCCPSATAMTRSRPGSRPKGLRPRSGRGPGGETRRTRAEERPTQRGPARRVWDARGRPRDRLGLADRRLRREPRPGKAAVGSNVTFVDGSAEKSDYRRKKLTDQMTTTTTCAPYSSGAPAAPSRARRPTGPRSVADRRRRGQLEAACDALEAVDWDVPAVAVKAEERVVTPRRTFSVAERRAETSSSACETRLTASPCSTTRLFATRSRRC